MTAIEDRDDADPPVDESVPPAMRFIVLDRRDDRVHLVSEDGDALYGHPSVYEEVWQAALTEVPPNWEIVDLSPTMATGDETVTETASETETSVDLDEFASRKYELFLAFLGAGFERCEALTLVIETLHGDDED